MPELSRLLDAVHNAANRLASVEDLDVVLRDVLQICIDAVGATGGTVYLHEPASQTLRFVHVLPSEVAEKLGRLDIPDNFGVAGRVFQQNAPEITAPTVEEPGRREIEERAGVTARTMLTVPLAIIGLPPIGVIQLVNKVAGPFDETDRAALETISDVCALAVMNARMMEQSKSVASLEGMGRAAHDLANKAGVLTVFLPDFQRNLEALRRCMQEAGMDGEARMYLDLLEGTFQEVFAPYSERVYRYARLINDLASGKKLEPKRRTMDFADVLREAVQYLEPLARESHVAVRYELERDAPAFLLDELYVMRIAENLVENAVKAVRDTIPDGWLAAHNGKDETYGTVTVRYFTQNDHHIVQVSDTGAGMAPGQIRDIMSGQSRSSWARGSGTGLGNKVVMELAAAHDAKVSITSKLGEGTTFTVDFAPVPASLSR